MRLFEVHKHSGRVDAEVRTAKCSERCSRGGGFRGKCQAWRLTSRVELFDLLDRVFDVVELKVLLVAASF
jgi:hypothetical protein